MLREETSIKLKGGPFSVNNISKKSRIVPKNLKGDHIVLSGLYLTLKWKTKGGPFALT